jgi:hypothetical protein
MQNDCASVGDSVAKHRSRCARREDKLAACRAPARLAEEVRSPIHLIPTGYRDLVDCPGGMLQVLHRIGMAPTMSAEASPHAGR